MRRPLRVPARIYNHIIARRAVADGVRFDLPVGGLKSGVAFDTSSEIQR